MIDGSWEEEDGDVEIGIEDVALEISFHVVAGV